LKASSKKLSENSVAPLTTDRRYRSGVAAKDFVKNLEGSWMHATRSAAAHASAGAKAW